MSESSNVEAKMSALASGGSCIGDVISPEAIRGKKIFIPHTVPGETVLAQVTRKKKSHLFGEVEKIIESSSERRDPPCQFFAKCGGCDLQHMQISYQREQKRKMLEDILRVQAGIVPKNGVNLIGADLPEFSYRKRISLHLNREGLLGFYAKGARRIVEIDQCLIATPGINQFINQTKSLLKESAPEVETITIEDHDGEIFLILELHHRVTDGLVQLQKKPCFEKLKSLCKNFRVNYRHKKVYPQQADAEDGLPVGHFSQNNEVANSLMIRRVVELVNGEQVTDMYAGAGNLSLPISLSGRKVRAVEVDSKLAAYGEHLAAQNSVSRDLVFYNLSCEKWIEKFSPDPCVVLDPPRSGAKEVVERLSPDTVKRVVYVSCYPPSFTRDAKILVERGYSFEFVEVFDMFPQTYHSELIALFIGTPAS